MKTIFPTLFCFVVFASPVSAQWPVPAARGKSIDVSLGFSYVSRPGGFSNRVGLSGADASFTIGYSRLGLKPIWAMRGPPISRALGVTRMFLLTWLVPCSTPPCIVILLHPFTPWAGLPGSVVLFPLRGADSFSGDGRRTSPGWQAAELITR